MQIFSPEQLKSRLDQGDAPTLLDVREPWEYEICQINGSINISTGNIATELDRLEPGAETVVICHHGARSLQVARYLESRGFSAVANLDGGIDAWARTVEQSMPQY
ncbi:MAG TPA: rhodanese-like domain-containing protein [Gammaproteobacteria bacterium]|nr:rhodanese-like domain-containing protein [Gammaproteobacteria bacterium]